MYQSCWNSWKHLLDNKPEMKERNKYLELLSLVTRQQEVHTNLQDSVSY